jgi:dihydroorotase
MGLLIKNAKIIDPKQNISGCLDVLVEKGKIVSVERNISTSKKVEVLEAKGKILTAGLIDMHTHLRQPGREDEETFFTASKAAIKGGFTSLVAMANTDPPIDNQGVVEFIYSEGKKESLVNIFCVGAVTRRLSGENLADLADLKRAGVVAFSDDGSCIKNSHTARRVFEYAKMLDMVVISHCEDVDLSCEASMNEGWTSTKLGFKGAPSCAESIMVGRDIQLAKLTGARVHFAHVSCKESVDLIRRAKKEKIAVSCETCPHYFTFSDEVISSFDTNFKVNPPLRSPEDVKAIKEGLADGTIDCITTDHAPHTEAEKDVEFEHAPFGMIGLQTALGISIRELVQTKILTLEELIKKFTFNPAAILKLKKGSLEVGSDADITVFDSRDKWTFTKEDIESKSKNSPFIGEELVGRVCEVIVGGKLFLKAGQIRSSFVKSALGG